MNDSVRELMHSVHASFAGVSDSRTRHVLTQLVRHLYEYASEVQLSRAEWLGALAFLKRVGDSSSSERDEFMLLSDVVGLSTLIDLLHQPIGATEGTVLGPYYAPGSPSRAFGSSMIDLDDGSQRLVVQGRVLSVDSEPLRNASVDVWGCAANGLYPAQDPAQPATNLRGLYTTDDDGRYEFVTLRPANYAIPTDGAVGELMEASSRPTSRAAHVHMIVSAPGHQSVVTHLFDGDSTCLRSDAVFSVRDSLVRKFERADDGMVRCRFDVVLARAAVS